MTHHEVILKRVLREHPSSLEQDVDAFSLNNTPHKVVEQQRESIDILLYASDNPKGKTFTKDAVIRWVSDSGAQARRGRLSAGEQARLLAQEEHSTPSGATSRH